MPIDDSRRPEPAEPQPGPVPSDDGLTINEFGRPPAPGETSDDGQEDEPAGSGGKGQPAGSGGKEQPAGSGGKEQPAGDA